MGCNCGGRRAAALEARRALVAERTGTTSPTTQRAMTAASSTLYEVYWNDGTPGGKASGRRFTSAQAARLFIGSRSGTIRPVR